MEIPFKQASTIGWFARNLEAWRSGGWLFIANTPSLTLNTPCYQQGWDARDLSPEEQDDLDEQIIKSGYRSFFEWGQLDMIVGNLIEQSPNYSDTELLIAIQHYWHHDAYIDLSEYY